MNKGRLNIEEKMRGRGWRRDSWKWGLQGLCPEGKMGGASEEGIGDLGYWRHNYWGMSWLFGVTVIWDQGV